ncbi:alpha/beta fold hydrolase [bacterium]|nr:alpha/beta fold hydrolase [bacterium]
MKKLFLLLSFLFLTLLISCGDDKKTEKNVCDNVNCNSWESCIEGVCVLNAGACNEKSNCKEWQTCINNSCVLDEGRCENNSQCGEKNYCNVITHYCDFDIKIVWGACPSYIRTAKECATVMMPYDYTDLNSERVPVFVFRHKSTSPNKKGQIWFLQGGPGGSGAVFDTYFGMMKNRYPEWDLYSLDHRGVGNSEKLLCSNEQYLGSTSTTPIAIENCVNELTNKYGENIKNFSARGAANDLGKLITLLKENDEQVFIYGVSYGTFWAHRYLQLFPNQANGVILDSIALNGYVFLDNYDKLANEVGKQFMTLCEEDSTCSQKMGTIAETPWDAMKSVFDKFDSEEICEDFRGYSSDNLRMLFFQLLAGGAYTRNLIPPIIYRLNRCSENDVAVLSNFINNMFGSKKDDYVPEDQLDSNILYYNIAFNEIWDGITVEEALELNQTYLFSTNGVAGNALIGKSNLWPTYDEPLLSEYSSSETPILMLNGTLDPQTPLEIALPAKDKFNKANQTFLTVPYSAHGVISQSVTIDSLMGRDVACGEKIIFEFIDNPTKEVSTKCFEDLIPVEFGNSEFNQYLSYYMFGTADMWEGSLGKTTPTKNENIERALEILKRTNYKTHKKLKEIFIK